MAKAKKSNRSGLFLAVGDKHHRAVSVWVPTKTHSDLVREAAANHRSLSGHVSFLLEQHFAPRC